MTMLTGRLGGAYQMVLTGENTYRVQTLFAGKAVTLFTGDYATVTKVMDHCVLNDFVAQNAVQSLVMDGDPSGLIDLIEAAKSSQASRGRRKVSVVCEIETDVLEGENAIALVNERLSQACQMAGVRLALIQASYIDPEEQGRMRDLGRIARERDFLLDNCIKSPDGKFTFPDGATYPCGQGDERPEVPVGERFGIVRGGQDPQTPIKNPVNSFNPEQQS